MKPCITPPYKYMVVTNEILDYSYLQIHSKDQWNLELLLLTYIVRANEILDYSYLEIHVHSKNL